MICFFAGGRKCVGFSFLTRSFNYAATDLRRNSGIKTGHTWNGRKMWRSLPPIDLDDFENMERTWEHTD